MIDLALKNSYRGMVKELKKSLKAAGKPHRNEDLADVLGYDRTYFSTLLGQRGNVTEKHIKEFKLHFPTQQDSWPQSQPAGKSMTFTGASSWEVIIRLAAANEKLSDANQRLARGNEELIAMTRLNFENKLKESEAPLKKGKKEVVEGRFGDLSLDKNYEKKQDNVPEKDKVGNRSGS